MVVTTTSDHIWGFSITFEDRLVFRVTQLPQNFAFQPLGANYYFVSRALPGFVSHRKFILTDAMGTEIATLTGKFFYAVLNVGENSYRVKAKSWFMTWIGRHFYEIPELGIQFVCREKFFNTEVRTETNATDEGSLAIIVLLHFARIYQWRDSG